MEVNIPKGIKLYEPHKLIPLAEETHGVQSIPVLSFFCLTWTSDLEMNPATLMRHIFSSCCICCCFAV